MVKQDIILIKTADGSDSLFTSRFQDSYHSQHGAIQESNHVFIQQGLSIAVENKKSLQILELGFGAGLNVLLTRQFFRQHPGLLITYHTVEAFPLPPGIVEALNYGKLIHQGWFREIHVLPWNVAHDIEPGFTLTKQLKHFEEISESGIYDLIYFDAFGPRSQPELWQQEFLSIIARATRSQGILVTYCSQGAFRRSLEKVGFSVTKLPGPPGKREMVRAVKD
jgi:tRNA U34 5-methylaminomethyl-2-thiouridine-forming methyltransferase MnmC